MSLNSTIDRFIKRNVGSFQTGPQPLSAGQNTLSMSAAAAFRVDLKRKRAAWGILLGGPQLWDEAANNIQAELLRNFLTEV